MPPDPVKNSTVWILGIMPWSATACSGMPVTTTARVVDAIDRNTAAIDRQTDALA
jgi:hypothetical protein